VTPSRANYSFTPDIRSLTVVGTEADALFAAEPTAVVANPLDTNIFFVRQQYLDFLSREPDTGGLEFWTSQLNKCGRDAACLEHTRIDVSAAFFMSEEFEDTGFFVYRIHKASFGLQPGYQSFIIERAGFTAGPRLDASKQAFAEQWIKRDDFNQKYPANMSPDLYIATLNANAGGALSTSEQNSLVGGLSDGSLTREQALERIVENSEFRDHEYNQAFVLMQYYGYLGRDVDQGGYVFWLNVLNNRDTGNYRGMVCSFLTSAEYQYRFASIQTHYNQECR
jgi:hypothetical protein